VIAIIFGVSNSSLANDSVIVGYKVMYNDTVLPQFDISTSLIKAIEEAFCMQFSCIFLIIRCRTF
jgi:hypothetical protein